MTNEEAIKKAENQLSQFAYIAETSPHPGIAKINSNKAEWLCRVLHYARKGLRDQQEPKWISAEQPPHFTPNRWRRVLVTLEDKDGKRFTTIAKYNEEWKQWEQFNDARFFDSRNFKVVAWMPKPEPWKGENSENN